MCLVPRRPISRRPGGGGVTAGEEETRATNSKTLALTSTGAPTVRPGRAAIAGWAASGTNQTASEGIGATRKPRDGWISNRGARNSAQAPKIQLDFRCRSPARPGAVLADSQPVRRSEQRHGPPRTAPLSPLSSWPAGSRWHSPSWRCWPRSSPGWSGQSHPKSPKAVGTRGKLVSESRVRECACSRLGVPGRAGLAGRRVAPVARREKSMLPRQLGPLRWAPGTTRPPPDTLLAPRQRGRDCRLGMPAHLASVGDDLVVRRSCACMSANKGALSSRAGIRRVCGWPALWGGRRQGLGVNASNASISPREGRWDRQGRLKGVNAAARARPPAGPQRPRERSA